MTDPLIRRNTVATRVFLIVGFLYLGFVIGVAL
jgi:hypothetical protein